MDTMEAISQRRSIRKFVTKEVPKETVERILEAAILAPSAKNAQPWKFIVVTNAGKIDVLQAMKEGLENAAERMRENPDAGMFLSGAMYSLKIMEQAPVTVFVFNTVDGHPWAERTMDMNLAESANTQSIGAAIQNMLLAAESLGVGSLWICDVFFAYQELCRCLGEECQLVAAVSLGYADESPNQRPRKPLESVVRWW